MRRSLITCLVSAAMIAMPLTAAAFDGPVLLKRDISVSGDIVRLGDIFAGLAADRADTPVGRAPAAGQRIELDARWLAALAQAYKVDWQPRSHLDVSHLERESLTLTPEQIEAMVGDAMREEGISGNLVVSLELPAQALHLPVEAEGGPAITGLSRDTNSGRFAATLIHPAHNPHTRIRLSGRLHEMVEVPVLTRRLGREEPIGPADIEWAAQRADRLPADAVHDAEQLVGMALRRAVRPGDVIRSADLRAPVLVPRNSLVTIRLENGPMLLTVQGRALEDGARGAVIRVMNTKSNNVVNAVVAEAGTVEVPQGEALIN